MGNEAAARGLAIIALRLHRDAHEVGEQGFSKTTDLWMARDSGGKRTAIATKTIMSIALL